MQSGVLFELNVNFYIFGVSQKNKMTPMEDQRGFATMYRTIPMMWDEPQRTDMIPYTKYKSQNQSRKGWFCVILVAQSSCDISGSGITARLGGIPPGSRILLFWISVPSGSIDA